MTVNNASSTRPISDKSGKNGKDLASKVCLEQLLSFKWIHPSKFVTTRKSSSDSDSSSASSPTRLTEDAQDVSSIEVRRREDREFEIKMADEASRKANKAACAKARKDRRRAMKMEKEEEKVIVSEGKMKKSNEGRAIYRPY
uniref:BZIP domain-containing protein n=1 Tax=Caenorhabditis tropicalis TaxID=1561998 RepID=A0A1I7TY42_9PELO